MQTEFTIKKPDLLKATLIFSVVGIFIPGFTEIGLLVFQMLLTSFGIECHNVWTVLWTLTVLGAIILPVLFYQHITTLTKKN